MKAGRPERREEIAVDDEGFTLQVPCCRLHDTRCTMMKLLVEESPPINVLGESHI